MVSAGVESLFFGQVPIPDWSDEGPVASDRAALQTDKTEVDRLELHTRNPKSRKQVPLSAPDHDMAADHVAEAASYRGTGGQYGRGHVQLLMPPTSH